MPYIGDMCCEAYHLPYHGIQTFQTLNPLPDMPILSSSNLTPNKDMLSKTWTNGDTVI